MAYEGRPRGDVGGLLPTCTLSWSCPLNFHTSPFLRQTSIKPYYLPGRQVLGAGDKRMGWNLRSNRNNAPERAAQVWH